MSTDWTQNGRGLKLLVAVMTLLLVAGLVLLVVGLARTAGELSATAPAPLPGFPDLELTLPAGMRIVETTAAGTRLYVRAEDAGGRGVIFVVDAEAGQVVGRIRVTP